LHQGPETRHRARTTEIVMFSHPEAAGHELVQFVRDPTCGLRAIIALHSTVRGPAFGGCRMWPYATEAQALADALRLSRGMTCKAAILDLPYGGGKTVVIGDPARDKSRGLLRALAGAVERLHGRYIIADDVGTTLKDLAVMRQVTRHTAAATGAARKPLAVTAYGVFMAIRAAVRHRFDQADLTGLKVAVQGLGHVGLPLCGHLHKAGAALVIADLDPQRTAAAARRFGATVVEPPAIFCQAVDLLAPCAFGGVLDDRTIPRLRAKLVVGGANNQLGLARHDAMLAERGILYVPDYIANAGGVIDFDQEQRDDRPEAVLKAVERIHDVVQDVLKRAEVAGATPLTVADQLVALRLQPGRTPRLEPAAPTDAGA
jgi:leucine dehydrogenase